MRHSLFALGIAVMIIVASSVICVIDDSSAATAPASVDITSSDTDLYFYNIGSSVLIRDPSMASWVSDLTWNISHQIDGGVWDDGGTWRFFTDDGELVIDGFAIITDSAGNRLSSSYITGMSLSASGVHIDFTFPDTSKKYYVGFYMSLVDCISAIDVGDAAVMRPMTYSAPTRTVTFDPNGGTVPVTSLSGNAGTSIILPAAEKPYCTFAGWYTSSNGGTRIGGAGESYVLSVNETLYAQYNNIPVVIASSQSNAFCVMGTSFGYNVSVSPLDSVITVSGASWLSVSGKSIAGTPTASNASAGIYHVTVTAIYGTQSAVQTFDITVVEKLIFESVPTGGIIANPV